MLVKIDVLVTNEEAEKTYWVRLFGTGTESDLNDNLDYWLQEQYASDDEILEEAADMKIIEDWDESLPFTKEEVNILKEKNTRSLVGHQFIKTGQFVKYI